jgi:hypothetical protein
VSGIDAFHESDVPPSRRWLRLIGLMDAADWAGLSPIGTPALHSLSYLAEVLSPIWSMRPSDGKVLKAAANPYFPALQQDLDRLIGMGMVAVNHLMVVKAGQGPSRLEGTFSLNREFADPVLNALRKMADERDFLQFLQQVAQAYAQLSDEELADAMTEDATYGDSNVDAGDVIDLGEWSDAQSTPTARAARAIRSFSSRELMPAETIDIYVMHIVERMRDEK